MDLAPNHHNERHENELLAYALRLSSYFYPFLLSMRYRHSLTITKFPLPRLTSPAFDYFHGHYNPTGRGLPTLVSFTATTIAATVYVVFSFSVKLFFSPQYRYYHIREFMISNY